MASLATCIQKAGDLLSKEDRQTIMLAAQEFRRKGMKVSDAERAALEQHAGTVDALVTSADLHMAGGRVQVEPAAAAPAPEQVGPLSALDAAAQRFPDLHVQMDGMDKPLPLAEFLAAAKAEADDLAADAPLMQVAAECALALGT